MKLRNITIEIVTFLYVCLFLYTGAAKLMDYEISREQMDLMPLVGPIAGIVTWLLPVSEIILAVLIFLPVTRLKGLYLGTALMLAFTIYVAYMMKYYSHLPCTCGGLIQSLTWPQHLIFNAAFVVLGILAIYLSRKSHTIQKSTKLSHSH